MKSKRDEPFVEYVVEQLRDLPALTCRAMFGGYGLYARDVFFGIAYDGQLYFKTTDATRPEYERRGSRPFRPRAKQTLKRYYEVPADVLDDRSLLLEFARSAAGVTPASGSRARSRPAR